MEQRFDFNWQDYLREEFTDDYGNYLLGIENGKTPEYLLQKKGIEINTDVAEGRELYNIVRSHINAFMKEVRKKGYSAGSVSRSPSTYFIAKNDSERKMLINKAALNNIGRLNTIKRNGQNLITDKNVNKVQKQLEEFTTIVN